jgi:DNA repair protein RecO (recombination protein O)
MLHTTRGIALHTVKFSETSIVVKIYTERFGLQSYLVRGIRKEHSKTKAGLFQPLTLLDLTVYHKGKTSLQAIKEVSILRPYHSLPFDIRKSSIALFINELLVRSIREEEENRELFGFLYETCLELDAATEGLSFFPLVFAVALTRFLGFYPRIEGKHGYDIFNMADGVFQQQIPDHKNYLLPPMSLLLKEIIGSGSYHPDFGILSEDFRRLKNDLLEGMLLYYRLHLPAFGEIRSHKVLHTVLT